MKNDLHTARNWLLRPLAEAEWVRLKTQRMPGEMTPQLVGPEGGKHIDYSRLRPGRKLRMCLLLVLSCCLSTALATTQKPVSTEASSADTDASARHSSPTGAHHAALDRSGKTRKGKASYYGREFYRKKMADGTPMNPQSNVAASKTLPIGTKARVTNLENGNSEVVEIRDRGPYVKNRIVDVSPKTADKLGLKENGTAPVEVKPVEVPQSDGSVKPGTGAAAP
jgi:rare lipoprotein A